MRPEKVPGPYSFVTSNGPGAEPDIDVRFLESTPTYESAYQRRAELLPVLAPGMEIVIYRNAILSYANTIMEELQPQSQLSQVFPKRAISDSTGWDSSSTLVGFDLFLAPSNSVPTTSTASTGEKLARAVRGIIDQFGQDGDNDPPGKGP